MDLQKTTIIPTDDQAVARRMLTSAIFEDVHVLLVVYGTESLSEFVVAKADILARAAPWRRVVWLRRPEQVSEVLQLVSSQPDLPSISGPDVVAFSLSMGDEVHDVILRDDANLDPPLGKARIYTAFTRAEAG